MLARQRRLTVFSREYPPVIVGGTSTVARDLARGLAANDWQVTVVSTNPGSAADAVEADGDVHVYRIAVEGVYGRETALFDTNLRVHRRLLQAAVRAAEQVGPPDIVAFPDIFCYPEASLLSRRHNVPVVNVLLQDFRTLTAYDRDHHRVTNGVHAEAEMLFSLEEKVLRDCDYCVFISNALSDSIRAYYSHLPFAGGVTYLGVDVAEIESVAAGERERAQLRQSLPEQARPRRLIVACGRLVPVKGFDILVRSLPLLAALDLHVVIVGVGPESGYLHSLALTLGVGSRVTFVQEVPRRTALLWISMANVAVVPSLWESFCLVCAEMMALGRPVVACAIDSLNELIPTNEFGYRIEVAGSSTTRRVYPQQLAAAIESVLGDPCDAVLRAGAGRRRVMENFTSRRFGSSMASLCADLAGAVR